MSSGYVVETIDLTKKYGKKYAANKVNMHVKKGAIYGIIGRNGAGKTTVMKIIAGLSTQTSGEVKLFDGDGKRDITYRRMGVLIEAPGLYPNMSAYANLKCKAICLGLSDYKTKIDELLEIVGLADVKKKKIKKYSLGMKQRLGIAMALLSNPDVLVLDEPINGLDPQGILEVRDLIIKINKEKNITVIISSHILEELIKVVTDFAIVKDGEILEELSIEEFNEKCKEKIEITVDDVDKATTIIEKLGYTNYKVANQNVIKLYEGLSDTANINRELVMSDIAVKAITVNNEGIEEYFVNITGK